MTGSQKHYRLGDLLLEAEILSSEYIKEALTNYESQGLPLGKVLVIAGYLNDQQLKSALDLQFMVNDRLLDFNGAVEVLKLCHREKKSISEAFIKANIVKPEDNETNKLGQLLINAEILVASSLDECLITNETTSLPLGHIICHRGLVSQPLINRALAIQNLVRTGHITRDSGISSLKAAHKREIELAQLEANKGYVRKPLKGTAKIGELFASCGILNEAQISEILIASIIGKIPFGEALVQKSGLTKQHIEAAVEIQELLDRKTIEKDQAINALTNIITHEISTTRAVSEAHSYQMVPNQAVPLVDLLKTSGIITNAQINRDIQECLTVNYNQVKQVVNILKEDSIVDDTILFSSLRLVELLKKDKITYEKAIVALEFSQRTNTDIEYTLYMTGYFDRTRLREAEYPALE